MTPADKGLNVAPVGDLFESFEQGRPPEEGWLTADERASLCHNGTPFYIGKAEVRDSSYGEQVVYSVYINPSPGDDPVKRLLAFKLTPARERFMGLTQAKLRSERKALGPFYLGTEGGGNDRSPRWELRETPQTVAQSMAGRQPSATDDELLPF